MLILFFHLLLFIVFFFPAPKLPGYPEIIKKIWHVSKNHPESLITPGSNGQCGHVMATDVQPELPDPSTVTENEYNQLKAGLAAREKARDAEYQKKLNKLTPSMRKIVTECVLQNQAEGYALQSFMEKHKLEYIKTDDSNSHCFYEALLTCMTQFLTQDVMESWTAVHLKYDLFRFILSVYPRVDIVDSLLAEVTLLNGSFISFIFQYLLCDSWADVRLGKAFANMMGLKLTILTLAVPDKPSYFHYGGHLDVEDADLKVYWNNYNHFTALGTFSLSVIYYVPSTFLRFIYVSTFHLRFALKAFAFTVPKNYAKTAADARDVRAPMTQQLYTEQKNREASSRLSSISVRFC